MNKEEIILNILIKHINLNPIELLTKFDCCDGGQSLGKDIIILYHKNRKRGYQEQLYWNFNKSLFEQDEDDLNKLYGLLNFEEDKEE